MRREELCFVQFSHPGGEHRPRRRARSIEWNERGHKRKFVASPGRALRKARGISEGDFAFWTEWEPQSKVVEEITRPIPGGPRFVWRPHYQVPPRYRRHQNSDPLVLGGFFYSNCRQWTKKGPTQLGFLKPGSVILFGSSKGGKFVVDTVFVVERHQDYHPAQYESMRVPQVLKDVTLASLATHERVRRRFELPQAGCGPGGKSGFRLYFGATYDRPYEGMFSYFPCLRYAPGGGGFARPAIRLPGIINPASTRGIRLNPQESVDDVRRLWKSATEQVYAHGLELGIEARTPDCREP